jgi:hypothetical protein
MVDIAYLERKKTEIVADHIRREGASPLNEAEQWIIKELDWQIKQLSNKENEE